MQFRCSRCSSSDTKISVSQLSLVQLVQCQVQLMITRYSTDVEDFCVSVEFGAVGAVGAVKFKTLYINFKNLSFLKNG